MIIYQDGYTIVEAGLDVPVVLTFHSNNMEYHYHLDGTTTDVCPYDTDIKQWIKKARPDLNEIIWAKNEHRTPNQITIKTPLKLKMRLNLKL